MTEYLYHQDGTLPPKNSDYIFVFGSNLSGIHGASAALIAKNIYGAIQFNGIGKQGNSYAIPTKDKNIRTLPLDAIQKYVEQFKEYTLANPDKKFWITRVGCGLAGFKNSNISPFFRGCSSNCNFPLEWKHMIEETGSKILYAGIGSRETPASVLDAIRAIARRFGDMGYTLRSGGADGADTAFEEGCDETSGGEKEIWLPWKYFNGRHSTFFPTDKHFEIASQVHPAWNYLTKPSRSLHARNVGQILGADLNTPVDFVLCYTKDGAQTKEEVNSNTGGTGTAVKLASMHNIPVFNLKNKDALNDLKLFLKTLKPKV